MKDDINRYNLPIDNSNYFVKKAELILSETLKIYLMNLKLGLMVVTL